MTDKVALYARVSTENQKLEPQVKKLERWAENRDVDYELFKEKVSSIKERPQFEKIMENLDEYDKIVVTKIDRFARSIQRFNRRMNVLEEHDTDLEAVDQPIKTDDEMYGDFFRKMLALFAEHERKMIRRRLEEGFKKAKEEGRVGRPKKDIDMDRVVELWEKGVSVTGIAKIEGVSRATIYNRLEDEKSED